MSYNGFTEARARANKKYMEKYVEVKIRMEAEERDKIKAYAESKGESVNSYIKRLIEEDMANG